MRKTPFLYFFVHFHHTILAAALQGQQRTNIFLLCALFFPEVLDKNCSIVLFFLTAGYYSAILLLTLDTHKLIISGGFSVWNTSPTSARTAAIRPLKEHLEGTAELSAEFAASFGSSSHAKRTALLHDIGKYSPNGQRRQRDPEHTAKVDHSTAGAKAAADLDDMHAAFAIAGHHGGLPDLGNPVSASMMAHCAHG